MDPESGEHPATVTRTGLVGWISGRYDDDNFEIDAKEANTEALARWRASALVLNAARRFRYTKNLHTRVKGLTSLQQFRVGGLAVEAVRRFKAALPKELSESVVIAQRAGFSVGSIDLEQLIDKADMHKLRSMGGLPGVASTLKSNLHHGLTYTPQEAATRKEVFGDNTYPEKAPKTFFSFVWDAAQDVTLMILMVCALASIVVGIPTEGLAEGWYDGVGILFSIILVVFVTASSDYQQSLQFIQLDAEKKKISIEVIRDRRRQKLSVFDLLVGDVVVLSIGDIIPADGLFIHGHSLIIDESSMTGEAEPRHKDSSSPFLQAGTKVQDGSATMLCTGVGMHTQWGHLMATLSDSGDEETPLQVKLSGVATLIGNLGLYVAGLVFLVLMIRFLISDVDYSVWHTSYTLTVVQFFAIAVTIVVVAVPEGLPLAVTLTLAYAMKRMMVDKALVRKLAACETMGSATTICSDKTGTLTTNKMTVVRMWVEGRERNLEQEEIDIHTQLKQMMLENIFQNTNADVDEGGAILGSPTESAILTMALTNLNGNSKTTRTQTDIVAVNPFNSKRKRMGCIIRLPDGTHRVHWKGASEIILSMCDNTEGASGESHPVDHEDMTRVITSFADDALRTLGLAYRDLKPEEVPEGDLWPESVPLPDSRLTLLGIVGIKDPLRPGVAHAVRQCQKAGIKVRMVTGDNLSTAKAIARECGIFTDGEAIEGPVFRTLNPVQMRALIPNLQVMARSSPTDKHTLVKELRAMGEVVAVTGDGTNDAPALHEADIGLAMGIAGTEVAKESADIVVLDDNFGTIVQVAKWGRSVSVNIQKFVQFQLTVNIVALVINFVSACITGSAPLTAVQLLWVNLIMDTLGALALATEPPNDALLERPPVGRKGRFITNVMWRNIMGQAVYQLIVLGVMQYAGLGLLGYSGDGALLRLNTMIFNTFVFCQVFNEFNARDMEKVNVLKGLYKNTVFISVMFFTVTFQVILVEFLGKFASTVPLSLREWGLCILIGFVSMPIAVLVKYVPVNKDTTPFLHVKALCRTCRQYKRNGYVHLDESAGGVKSNGPHR